MSNQFRAEGLPAAAAAHIMSPWGPTLAGQGAYNIPAGDLTSQLPAGLCCMRRQPTTCAAANPHWEQLIPGGGQDCMIWVPLASDSSGCCSSEWSTVVAGSTCAGAGVDPPEGEEEEASDDKPPMPAYPKYEGLSFSSAATLPSSTADVPFPPAAVAAC